MAQQLGFHHDMRRCTGCRACLMACRDNRRLEPGLKWREVYAYPEGQGRHYLSVACNHCAEPECVRVCVSGVFSKRMDGVVVQETARCTGCRICMLTCPHGAPKFSPRDRKVTKCDFCTDRLDQGLEPACVSACPTQALSVIDIKTFAQEGALASVPGFPGSDVTSPSVRFTVPAQNREGAGAP